MLLYQYEIWTTDSPEKWWTFYLCGAKRVIAASAETVQFHKDESAILMDWIYYHEVISDFSLRHWAQASTLSSFCRGPLAIRPGNMAIDGSPNSSRITCPMDVLDLIRIICKQPSTYQDDFASYPDADMERIQDLRQRLQGSVGEYGTFRDISEAPLTRTQMLAYLYRCAALIYLNRAVFKAATTSFQHRRLIREGILVLQNLGFCESAWPMFIIACEAIEDEQRLHILDTLSQTQRDPLRRSNHVPLIHRMIETIWKQHDLSYDSNVDYTSILHAVISTAPALPLFA
ncbi:hypothetical protein N7513_001391 [Penicillium frequentans]|nr:hypothetical protein N7513_001391 [Penicillium glabrum]